MTVVIREAVANDLHAVCVLGKEVNRLHHEAWPKIFASPTAPDHDASHWEQSIAKPDATTFVGEISGQVIAFITVAVATESNPLLQAMCVARIGSVCVSAEHRRRGIGRSLMARAEQWARERDARDIRLNVFAFNGEALKLYEKLGYAVRSHALGKELSGAG